MPTPIDLLLDPSIEEISVAKHRHCLPQAQPVIQLPSPGQPEAQPLRKIGTTHGRGVQDWARAQA